MDGNPNHKASAFFILTLSVVGVFYVLFCAEFITVLFTKPLKGLRVWPLVFGTENIVYAVSQAEQNQFVLPEVWVASVERLHRGNPVILSELARYASKQKNYDHALALAYYSVELDPKNLSRYALVAAIRKEQGDRSGITEEVLRMSKGFLPDALWKRVLTAIAQSPPEETPAMKNSVIDYGAYTNAQAYELLARAYYLFGFSQLDSNPKGAFVWWQMASAIDPGTSYYAVEAADVLIGKFHDKNAAVFLLKTCEKNIFAGEHCSGALSDMERGVVADPGFYYHSILGSDGVIK